MKKIILFITFVLLVNMVSASENASVVLHGEKTDVILGEDIILKLSAVNIITKPIMTVQVIIIPPSGMSVTSSEFVTSGAGQFTSTFKLDPGEGKPIEVRIKSNQVGDFNVTGRVIYYFGNDTSTREDGLLSLPINVRTPPLSTEDIKTSTNSWISIGFVFLIIVLFTAYIIFNQKNKNSSIKEVNEMKKEKLKTFTNSIGMEFVLIPAGEFDMGSPISEKDRENYENPVHRVKIANNFYMGKYEVTQKQWNDIMSMKQPSPSYFEGNNLPVEQVSWNDVQNFIKKLNEKEGGDKYRLPTEAEWEYAARAGTITRYSFGDDESHKSKLDDYAWYSKNSDDKTHEVGQKKPNPWGLYDMHGNVWEWVQDGWHTDYNGAPTDGSSWESDDDYSRVFRGGGWGVSAGRCRSAIRSGVGPDVRRSDIGFRIVKSM